MFLFDHHQEDDSSLIREITADLRDGDLIDGKISSILHMPLSVSLT
jgi:hypothetical protein